MAAIDEIVLQPAPGASLSWAAAAVAFRHWAESRHIDVRDAVLLLPFAALLAPARAALVALGGWQPRVETPLTLAAALGPPPAPAPGRCCGDAVLDSLAAGQLLRSVPWGAELAGRDAQRFDHCVQLVVQAAQSLRRTAVTLPPAERLQFWQSAREGLTGAAGPAATEALLLRLALEWAAEGSPAATDTLFDLRPSAWACLRLGGADRLSEAALASTNVPALRLRVDPPDAEPFSHAMRAAPARTVVCDSLEDEAQAAADEVIFALQAGRMPVALVTLDRLLARRVQALLARQHVDSIDETGWKLSTTPAAARLMSLLRAAAPGASADDRLDWMKAWPPARDDARALASLEAQWREARRVPDAEAAQRLWAAASERLAPWQQPGGMPLSAWLRLLADRAGDVALDADLSGRHVRSALRLDLPEFWDEMAPGLRLRLPAFTKWVDSVLEAQDFLPPPQPQAAVVLTPLARAVGRPFGQIVVPGADHVHLADTQPGAALISDRWAAALGLETVDERRLRRRLALAHVLCASSVVMLRRRLDGDEPLAPSPDVEWLSLLRLQAGEPPLVPQAYAPALVAVPRTPVARPLPQAAQALPERLTASSVEALRACPYRFFARAVLRLEDLGELDAELEKRDYGNWLHEVLYRFHKGRTEGGDDARRLAQAAVDEAAAQGLEPSRLLPYQASFETLAPAYLRWLSEREQQGWQWAEGETSRTAYPGVLQPQHLYGRLDRVDRGPGAQVQVVDYKTGACDPLKKSLRDPTEETQLAFYAALDAGVQSALYLTLDEADSPVEIHHPDVRAAAELMVPALASEMARVRSGAALPALGEGAVCETCEARGLCRRDHWADAS